MIATAGARARLSRPLRALLAFGLVGTLAGCAKPLPADLVGVWRTTDTGEGTTIFEFRNDGTFIRSSRFAGLTLKTSGTYKIGPREIEFRLNREGAEGRSHGGPEAAAYRFDGQALVLYPGTEHEQRYLLVR